MVQKRKQHAFGLPRETLSLDARLRDAFVAARCDEDAALASDARVGALLGRDVVQLAAQLIGQCDDGGLAAGTQVGAWRVPRERRERTPDDTAAIAAAHALLARVARARKRRGEAAREQSVATKLLAAIEAPDPDLVREISARAAD